MTERKAICISREGNYHCTHCGARFTHTVEVDDLDGYEGWDDGDDRA